MNQWMERGTLFSNNRTDCVGPLSIATPFLSHTQMGGTIIGWSVAYSIRVSPTIAINQTWLAGKSIIIHGGF